MRILGFETRNTVQGIRNWIQYPNSTDKDWNLVHGDCLGSLINLHGARICFIQIKFQHLNCASKQTRALRN